MCFQGQLQADPATVHINCFTMFRVFKIVGMVKVVKVVRVDRVNMVVRVVKVVRVFKVFMLVRMVRVIRVVREAPLHLASPLFGHCPYSDYTPPPHSNGHSGALFSRADLRKFAKSPF